MHQQHGAREGTVMYDFVLGQTWGSVSDTERGNGQTHYSACQSQSSHNAEDRLLISPAK